MAQVRAATIALPNPQLGDVATNATATGGPFCLLSDLTTLVVNQNANKNRIGVSSNGGTSITYGYSFPEGNTWSINGVIETLEGELLVSLRAPTGTAGVVYKSTGFNKVTGNATTWTKVLTSSGPDNWFDGRWGFTQRSVAPAWSARAGEIYLAEYGKHVDTAATPDAGAIRVWRSKDNGATFSVIFDLRDRYPGLTARLHNHGVSYDPYDDRVLVVQGDGGQSDGGQCGIWYCNGESLDSPTWTLVPGSQTSSSLWQTTTIIPMETGLILLGDGGPYGVNRLARRGYRRYAPTLQAVAPIGNAIIGGTAWRNNAWDPGAPLLISYVASTASGPPSLISTIDGEVFTEIVRDTVVVSGGAPGYVYPVGPDLSGKIYFTKNLTGSGVLASADYIPPEPVPEALAAGDSRFSRVKTIRSALMGGLQNSAPANYAAGNRGHRVPFKTPVPTSRWRFKIRNYDATGVNVGDAVSGLSGATIGKSAIGADGVPNGSYEGGLGVQLSTGGAYTIPNDGSYFVSPWYSDPAVQLTPGNIYLLSVANTIASGETKNVLLGTSWQFNGTNTVLDPTTAPSAPTPSQSRFDIQIEFETLTERKHGAFIGDSITEGNTSGRQAAYAAWPILWAASHRSIASNAAASGRTLANWAVTSHAVWTSLDWANLSFDFGFIAAGSNDVEASRTLAQMQADFLTTLSNLRAKIGTNKPIYASTVLPRKFATAKETVRTDYNAWLATLPGGIAGVFDFATIMTDPAVAAPPQIFPLYDSDGSHPKPSGYVRMASVPGELG